MIIIFEKWEEVEEEEDDDEDEIEDTTEDTTEEEEEEKEEEEEDDNNDDENDFLWFRKLIGRIMEGMEEGWMTSIGSGDIVGESKISSWVLL